MKLEYFLNANGIKNEQKSIISYPNKGYEYKNFVHFHLQWIILIVEISLKIIRRSYSVPY